MNDISIQKKISVLVVLATLVVLYTTRAADTNGTLLTKIGATVADKHYGETMVVTGLVVQVTVRPKVVFFNFEQPFPNSPFTGVVFSSLTNQFTNLPSLKRKCVEITGKITNYHDKPEIVLSNANQLKIIAPSSIGAGSQTPNT